MAISPISAAGASPLAAAARPQAAAAPTGFGDALMKGMQQVSSLEHQADAVTQSIATGGPAQIADLMVASTKASIAVDLLVQTRNRAVEAYQEVMRMPL
jgi:flagellar hook-basal body complex protein FliE